MTRRRPVWKFRGETSWPYLANSHKAGRGVVTLSIVTMKPFLALAGLLISGFLSCASPVAAEAQLTTLPHKALPAELTGRQVDASQLVKLTTFIKRKEGLTLDEFNT